MKLVLLVWALMAGVSMGGKYSPPNHWVYPLPRGHYECKHHLIPFYGYPNKRAHEAYWKCVDEYDQNRKVEEIYKMALKVNPGQFALTKKESKKLPDLIGQFIEAEAPCKKILPKYADFKIEELGEILREAKCAGNITSYAGRRVRRAIQNNDGSFTDTRRCYGVGDTIPRTSAITLTATCEATTTLTEDRFPRFMNELICDPEKVATCLKGEGVATQLYNRIRFRYDKNKQGLAKLGSWSAYTQRIRFGCSCNVKRDSQSKKLYV